MTKIQVQVPGHILKQIIDGRCLFLVIEETPGLDPGDDIIIGGDLLTIRVSRQIACVYRPGENGLAGLRAGYVAVGLRPVGRVGDLGGLPLFGVANPEAR